jgi:hypothetical protein
MLDLLSDEGQLYMLMDQSKDVILGNQLFRAKVVEESLFLFLLAYHDASLTGISEAFYHTNHRLRDFF